MSRSHLAHLAVALAALASFVGHAQAQFTYEPQGELIPGSGRGRVDGHVYAPSIRFPIRDAPAYANSQVYGIGGYLGPRGSLCDPANYAYPWHDNYCETRSHPMPLCPAGHGHQGQDIRASDCRNSVHPAVAVVDGRISHVGSFTVYLVGADGTQYEYLHMRPVNVAPGQRVHCGDVLGMVSNNMGRTSTSIHLHFNIRQAVRGVGSVFVPGYTSLVAAYERLLAGEEMCAPPMDAGTPDAAMPRDAAMSRDAASGRDAYVAPRDAYVAPRDAYVAPRDAFSARDSGGGCHSTTLGRTVSDGECVQLPPDRTDCSSSGCGWYACAHGSWACTTQDACLGTAHTNAGCSATGMSCYSTTLYTDIQHGGCVQVATAACGQATCGWYRCADGNWSCSDATACAEGERFAHPDCTDCGTGGQACNINASSCCPAYNCAPRTFGGSDNTCCLAGNLECVTATDCCGTMECVNQRCVCHNTGGRCAGDVDCCSGLWCTNGVCGTE